MFIGLPQVLVVADRNCIVIFILTWKVAATSGQGRNNHGGQSSAVLARTWPIMTLCSLQVISHPLLYDRHHILLSQTVLGCHRRRRSSHFFLLFRGYDKYCASS
jgi:hypothetical protein